MSLTAKVESEQEAPCVSGIEVVLCEVKEEIEEVMLVEPELEMVMLNQEYMGQEPECGQTSQQGGRGLGDKAATVRDLKESVKKCIEQGLGREQISQKESRGEQRKARLAVRRDLQKPASISLTGEKNPCRPVGKDGDCVHSNRTHWCSLGLIKKRNKTKHTCDICKRDFTNSNNFQKHQKTHNREPPFCKLCNKNFNRISNLNTHIKRIHSKEKTYFCEICSKGFKESYVLKRHIRTHTGERPYECEVCFKSFKIHSHLKEHKRIHTGETPYTCDICNKQIKRRYTLKCHMLFHMGQTPYCCDICTKGFTKAADLKQHMMAHSEGKPYACERCGREFSRKDSYSRHVKRSECRGSGRPRNENKI